jgi:stringent starvation protein B
MHSPGWPAQPGQAFRLQQSRLHRAKQLYCTVAIMSEISTKPYLLRAIYEWCTDNGFTPYLAAAVDGRTQVPREFVKNGEIVLNISFDATSNLKMDNDLVHFHARFGGVSREISVPVENVLAIYARENGQGMAFEVSKPGASGEGKPTQPVPVASIGGADTAPGSAPATLTSVPTATAEKSVEAPVKSDDTDPEPPKKGGRPTLTRIK